MALQFIIIKNNPVDSNCFLLFDKEINNKCLIVDPGGKDVSGLEHTIESNGLVPEYILLTHEHFDHVWGCNHLYEKYKIKAFASRLCTENMESSRLNCSRYYDGTGFEVHIEASALETVNNQLEWNGHKIEFFGTQGHSDASVCFITEKYLFTGDTLINGLKTVTNILSGSKTKLNDSIAKLEKLKGNRYFVCAGHGDNFELDTYDLNKMIK